MARPRFDVVARRALLVMVIVAGSIAGFLRRQGGKREVQGEQTAESLSHSRSGAFKLLAVLGALVAISITTAVGWQLRLDADQRTAAIALTGGDPERGARLTQEFGCSGCHTIKGVSGARGLVGPPLSDIARHVYVGGTAGEFGELDR